MPVRMFRRLSMPQGRGTRAALSWRHFWRSLLRRLAGSGTAVFSMRLSAGQELRLHEVAGWTLVCRRGALWITQEDDARDIFLKGDEGFALDRGGLALVRACRDSILTIRAPVGRESSSRSQDDARHAGTYPPETGNPARLMRLRSLYPQSGPWNDPALYRRAGLL